MIYKTPHRKLKFEQGFVFFSGNLKHYTEYVIELFVVDYFTF
jgi:hypothetical protein